MIRRAGVMLGVVLLLAGCARNGPPPAGFGTGASFHTLNVRGIERTYRLYRPAGTPASTPLVVMLHGGFGSARQAERSYEWDQLAESRKFVVAYPDGLNRAWNVNGGGCCGRSAREGVDDVAFISDAIDDVGRNIRVDPARVYATGMSNGAIMSYTLACSTRLFAAIGPVAGTQLDACPAPFPLSVMHIHGTGDPLVRYDGTPGAGTATIDGPSVPQLNEFWRNVDHCGAPASETNGLVTIARATCPDNRSVALVTVAEGGHEWPSIASELLWEFFAAHPR